MEFNAFSFPKHQFNTTFKFYRCHIARYSGYIPFVDRSGIRSDRDGPDVHAFAYLIDLFEGLLTY